MSTQREAEAITSHLLDYADQNEFEPLIARDYGSRARNLDGPGSDYDVMFLFVEPPSEYAIGADTETYTKTISADESRLNTEIELHGWSLKRFVGNDGVLGSNPTALELAAAGDHEYMWDGGAGYASELARLFNHTLDEFKPFALIQHYRSLSASNYGKYIEGDYKLSDSTSWSDLLDHIDIDWHAVSEDACRDPIVDEQESRIGEDWIEVYGRVVGEFGPHDVDTASAFDDGLIEPTTTDRTNKRYLNVCQALLRARYIEHTKQMPPMDALDLLRWSAEFDWLPSDAYAEIGRLCAQKKDSGGTETGRIDSLDWWIESELDREIEHEGYVERQPDTQVVRDLGASIYETIDWTQDRTA